MKKWMTVFGLALLLGVPVLAAPSINVTEPAALNGTYGLAVAFDGTGGKAYVQSSHPTDERTIRLDLNINPNNLSMCTGQNCRWAFMHTLGNRNGSLENTFVVLLKKNAQGNYKVILWVKDENSGNSGKFAGVDGFFVPADSTTKVSVEWTAATDGNSDGEVKVYKDDVLKNTVSNLGNRFEVDQVRVGHLFGAVKAAANGTMFVDDFVATRF